MKSEAIDHTRVVCGKLPRVNSLELNITKSQGFDQAKLSVSAVRAKNQ